MDELGELEKYKMAKKYFSYDKLAMQATDENGVVDEEKLRKLLEDNLERMIEHIETKTTNNAQDKKRLQDLFKMIIDRKSVEYFERLEQQEKYMRDKKINKKDLLRNSSIIAGTRNQRIKNGQTISMKVSPRNENSKNVKITKIGTLEYKTAFNLYADLQIYIVEKNIDGIDRNFAIATNTNFELANKLMNKTESLTEEEKQYLDCVSEQLSDINLTSTQRKLNGYTGTVMCYKGHSELEFDPEEYCAYNSAFSKDKEDERE